jgi:hypothetical protein
MNEVLDIENMAHVTEWQAKLARKITKRFKNYFTHVCD